MRIMNLPKGIELLKKVKEKARRGVGFHGSANCPINRAYRISSTIDWEDLTNLARLKLCHAGWNRDSYAEFLKWYDAKDDHKRDFFHAIKEREEILRRELA